MGDLVFGGHEIRATDVCCAATEFAERAGVLDRALLDVLREDLARRRSEDVRPGYLVNPGASGARRWPRAAA